jgi:predicted hotdog family 3-hydroxylacyl-ACP dehydratase
MSAPTEPPLAQERTFPPVAELVPHDAPMILVDELVEWSPTAARVRAQIRRGGPFVTEGRLPATVLLEYMAQAIAVADGMTGHVTGRRDIGLLLGTRELDLSVAELAVGDELDIRVEQRFADARLASYACEVLRDGERLAHATVNVMVAPPEELVAGGSRA